MNVPFDEQTFTNMFISPLKLNVLNETMILQTHTLLHSSEICFSEEVPSCINIFDATQMTSVDLFEHSSVSQKLCFSLLRDV